MAPATLMMDFSDDFVSSVPVTSPPKRTLLLAPPSLASNSDALSSVVSEYDRSVTDLQMLDRLSAGLVNLPPSTYDLVLILADASSMLGESLALMTRSVLGPVAEALKPSGRLQGQDGNSLEESTLSKEAVLAGLVASKGGFEKPNYGANDGVVSLKFGKKKQTAFSDGSVPLSFGKKNQTVLPDGSVPLNFKKKQTVLPDGSVPLNFKKRPPPVESKPVVPVGVGFIDLSDDLDDDDLIDEDDLMTEEDLLRPINIPLECQPKPGKRRRACKDCSCGLAERIASEDAAKREEADKKLEAIKKLESVKLATDDLAEVDFTVQGKVGSCGNCSLGDAFRCDGCPYIGLPPFKPGEEVRLLNNDIQL
ncbi:cytokine-induced anti-apoptosis inhibitor 1, Fe-S biogenesis-domain-containing protein [Thelonectria olida]|uniref:Cytokine-induced anti-apoptosis inhibitor 1, Fe-S biogenesis-domain-containing protein n=1 Tax=Thelonectria olida TaxID=1576542 RepID=A0A9P8WJX1_9HYPO|nr:cytokine-induced anti-apoptosis inhibitor 1, Fe-S biogenesis-domain-containing protein [Thelonectria olida]